MIKLSGSYSTAEASGGDGNDEIRIGRTWGSDVGVQNIRAFGEQGNDRLQYNFWRWRDI